MLDPAAYVPYRSFLVHQARVFPLVANRRVWAHFWEQRCMKTKMIFDTAAYQYRDRKTIDALVVIAWPNGVQHTWREEAELDLDPTLPWSMITWRSGRMTSTAARADLDALLTFKGLAVLALNCEALQVQQCWAYLDRFFRRRRVLLCADEASWAASGKAARTKRLLALGRRPSAVMRRILDGTPVEEGPEDVYYPCEFLQPGLLGFRSVVAFRARYSEYETDPATGERLLRTNHSVSVKRWNPDTRRVEEQPLQYPVLKGYRHLDELGAKLATFSDRFLRAELSDAPAKIYQKRFFQLSPVERRTYDRLRAEYVLELRRGDVPIPGVLLRLTRLQMVTRGYAPPERVGEICHDCGGEGVVDVTRECDVCGGIGIVVVQTDLERLEPGYSSAQRALAQELKPCRDQVVIWNRFHQDVTDAMVVSCDLGRRPVRFDGLVSARDREAAYDDFRAGRADDIVATVSSGLSRGRRLTAARLLIYYSNDFPGRHRRQSEDRAEALDREVATGVVDLIAEDTRDEDIVAALRAKRSVASLITGDKPTEWI